MYSPFFKDCVLTVWNERNISLFLIIIFNVMPVNKEQWHQLYNKIFNTLLNMYFDYKVQLQGNILALIAITKRASTLIQCKTDFLSIICQT